MKALDDVGIPVERVRGRQNQVKFMRTIVVENTKWTVFRGRDERDEVQYRVIRDT